MRPNLILVVVTAGVLGAAGFAQAQVPTVSPRGDTPVEAPPPSAPAAPASAPAEGGEAGVEEGGFYHIEDDGFYDEDLGRGPAASGPTGPVPEVHVVRRGDTLWDISALYFNDPWQWPRVWSYNPSITNPHWIYPGDVVRLYALGEGPAEPIPMQLQPTGDDTIDAVPRRPSPIHGVTLRQLAFVESDELRIAGRIVGSPEEKVMLAQGDPVYVEYAEGRAPKVGATYTIYTEQQQVTHPDGKEPVGAYVRVLGALQIQNVQKDKPARGVIVESVDVIERGARVGPVQRTFHSVEPTANRRNLRGTIVARLGSEELIGEGEIVFIDLGASQGVQKGNRLFVVRRGDARPERGQPAANVGQDDERFPARAVGEIVIVEAGKNLSVGLVTMSLQELGRGDIVLMRQSQ